MNHYFPLGIPSWDQCRTHIPLSHTPYGACVSPIIIPFEFVHMRPTWARQNHEGPMDVTQLGHVQSLSRCTLCGLPRWAPCEHHIGLDKFHHLPLTLPKLDTNRTLKLNTMVSPYWAHWGPTAIPHGLTHLGPTWARQTKLHGSHVGCTFGSH